MTGKKYIRKRSASTRRADDLAAQKKAGRAQDYAERWGRSGLAAFKESYDIQTSMDRAADRHPRVPRKTGKGTWRFEAWSLGRANVGRDKRTGRFTRRKVGR